jgi:hypothetical protein
MRPVEFEERFAATWALWVLDHGLPDLPDQMVEGLSVPIAFWAGQRVGAVMFVQRCPHDEECEADEHFTTDEVSFRRTDDGWIPAAGSSGVDWPQCGLGRLDVPARHVQFEEPGEYRVDGPDGWACVRQTAVVGRDAAWIELVEGDQLTRRPVNAPTGRVIVATPGEEPATIRILDSDQSELATCTVTSRQS